MAIDSAETLDIGYGLELYSDAGHAWHIAAKNGQFELTETDDFFRVLVLPESPYQEVKALVEGYAQRRQAKVGFPCGEWSALDYLSQKNGQAWH